MNAKELRDNWNNFGHDIRNLSSESNATILRALDLLAATEDSTDELVRELRDQADEERQFEYPERAKLLDMAAATIVALKAERDALKAHAEAMAEETANQYGSGRNVLSVALDAYRRDFPKDAP